MSTMTAPSATAGERTKLLLVDDEVAILDALRRQLRGKFEVATAAGAEEALALMATEGPFAAVLSDMQMPGTDGAAFLAEVRERTPDTVRLLLTGQADVATAVAAVNDGQIFRFLTKPCRPETILDALSSAVDQYRLVRAEKELLEKTLRGAVQSLIDVLSLAHPAAFSRAGRIAQIVTELSEAMTGRRDWEVEVTGLLAQIGAVTLPVHVLEKMDNGLPLSREERAMLAKVPSTSQDLLAHIPRLENVVAAIGYQRLRYDGTGRPPGAPRGDEIPLVARILRVALDFDMLRSQRLPPVAAIERLRSVEGDYDPAVLDAWQALHAVEGVAEELPIQVAVSELRTGMVLMEDVHNTSGMLLLGRGSVVTEAVIRRMENHVRQTGIRGSILVSSQRRERRGITADD